MRQRQEQHPAVDRLLDLSGRVALVTGAGRGIGAVIARRLAAAGAAITVHYRSSAEGAAEVVEAIRRAGGKAGARAADLSRGDQADRLIAGALEDHGRLDILVNNAGIYPVSPLKEMAEDEWDAVVDANLKSVFVCTRAAARVMAGQADGGAIVNIASVEGETPAPLHSHYTAAKAGVLMHTRSAALELGCDGIRVNAVSPGLIWKEGIEEDWPDGVGRWLAAAPLGRMGLPEEVADACLFLASPAAGWISGANLAVDGGILARAVF